MRMIAVLSCLMLATPALAADPAPVQQPAKEEKKICKREDSSVSRLGGRPICKTKAEWDADRENQQRQMDRRN